MEEQLVPVTEAALSVGQPEKMTNFILEKISDYIGQGQFAFTIPGQRGKQADSLPYNRNPGGSAYRTRWLGMHILKNLPENMSKFKWTNESCT